MQPLLEQHINSFWITPVIQGYVASSFQRLGKEGTIQYVLVSRRSSKRAGTRFYSRGVDDLGCVSNFVES